MLKRSTEQQLDESILIAFFYQFHSHFICHFYYLHNPQPFFATKDLLNINDGTVQYENLGMKGSTILKKTPVTYIINL